MIISNKNNGCGDYFLCYNADMPKKMPYQPLPPLLFAALFGILSDRFLALPPFCWTGLFFAALIAWFIFRRLSTIHIAIIPTGCMLICCAACFGFWHHEHWFRFAKNEIGSYATDYSLQGEMPAALRGIVAEMPRFYPKPPRDPGKIFETSEKTLFTLHAEQLRDGIDWIPVSGKVAITVYGDCRHLRIGDSIQLFGELGQPFKPNNPGDYDYSEHLRRYRILATLRCPAPSAISLLDDNSVPWAFLPARWMESFRRQGIENLQHHLSPQTLFLAEAMIFGVRESVDDEIQQSMVETGTMHLLAISGLHITLIAGIAAWILRLLRFSRRTAAVLLIFFVLFYLFLTDVRPPAIRAVALSCSVAIAFYANRQTSAVNLLCASALIVLMINPSELFQFGAQLSFIATGSILWTPKFVRLKSYFSTSTFSTSTPSDDDSHTLRDIERTENASWYWVRSLKRGIRLSAEVFLVSLTIWLFSMPLLLNRIHLFTPVALLVNPILWLPLTAAMSLGFMTAVLGHIPMLGNLLGIGADGAFRLLGKIIAWFQELGGHYWVAGPPVWWIFGFYAVFILFTFLPMQTLKKKVLLSALILWILAGFGANLYRGWERQQADRLTVRILSVGHGNATLLITPECRTIVCDAGSLTSPRYVAETVSRSLWQWGKTHIDCLLISHPDNDHFNGVIHLADRFSIGTVLISPYCAEASHEPDRESWNRLIQKLETMNIPIQIVGAGDDLAGFGLPHSAILHPPKKEFFEKENMNATSLVLRFEHGETGILLPADLDGRETASFLLTEPTPTEIIMIPHHGGKSSQTHLLLGWTTPSTLLFSTGTLSHRPELLKQYVQQGYSVHSTFTEGAIEINIEQRGIKKGILTNGKK